LQKAQVLFAKAEKLSKQSEEEYLKQLSKDKDG